MGPDRTTDRPVRLGLRENLPQFALLALVNVLVGGMVGLERTVTPLVGSQAFGLGDLSIALFVVAFGVTKAITNLVGGAIVGRYTRKTVLIAGWVVGLPVPLMLAYAPSWGWVIGANILLGINQGLTWSMTVNMKIDLIGPARRGLALGINETAGYLGVAITALATGYLATAYGLRPAPELLGVAYAVAGLALSITLVRDTAAHARLEAAHHHPSDETAPAPGMRQMFAEVTWRNRSLASISQAGLVNNLNDGLVWVLLPVLLIQSGVSLSGVGVIKAVYPFMWAAGMIATGLLADRIGRKPPIVAGMLIQAIGLVVIVVGLSEAFLAGIAGSFLLGVGTALVYPALLAAISDSVDPRARSAALGGYRFWRDLGYAVGALVGGITATFTSLGTAVLVAAGLTAASGLWCQIGTRETHPRRAPKPVGVRH
ncbi:MFS transporter [Pseudonocardia sp. CA-142604]|uniref:MFS transporter n=1 Tax=Pseudonocardia sp. CA-142604 TaxID=3240024 RepID=UPI003D8FCDF5